MENFAAWFPEVIAIQSGDNKDHGTLGKKYLETIKIPFKGEDKYSLEVKQSDENEKFITEGDVPPVSPRMTANFTKVSENETLVNWKMESRNKSILFRLLLLPLFRKEMSKRAYKGMANLKRLLEDC